MAYQTIWYYSNLPNKVIDVIEEDLKDNFDSQLEDSKIRGDDLADKTICKNTRKSKNAWIPTNHWIAGFVWHYIMKANRENFLYDLTNIDGEALQYTVYEEGEYYGWHTDSGFGSLYKPMAVSNRSHVGEIAQDFLSENCEKARKLSFSLLLSDPDTYEGGNLQFIDGPSKSYFPPKERGTIILFDSRVPHRVQKVTKGIRKSIVGWTVGPRFR